jgi:excisionase family DNA binding protein
MKAPLRLADIVTGLVIDGERIVVTEEDITELAYRFGGSAKNPETKVQQVSRGAGSVAASGWLVCAIADRLAAATVGAGCRRTGPLRIESMSWPSPLHAGDHVQLRIEILQSYVSHSEACTFVHWSWVLTCDDDRRVLYLVSNTMIEERPRRENLVTEGEPIAYRVSQAAALLGMSRYVLYEAIRDEELRAYRPKKGSDLRILPEDLREWVTRHPARPKGLG